MAAANPLRCGTADNTSTGSHSVASSGPVPNPKKELSMPLLKSTALALVLTIIATAAALALPPLDTAPIPPAPDYAQQQSWLAKPAVPTAPVDVFFVYPTVLFDDEHWLMDTTAPAMRAASMAPLKTQASVFEGQANIYAPMYRQMNLAGLTQPEEQLEKLKKIARNDVWRALNHYLEHENNGRPFFLAGHSQGSLMLTDLMLEHWGTTGAEKRMIAALLIGWCMTEEELAAHPAIAMCEAASDTGCVVSYNTMAPGRQDVAPTLRPGAAVTNPLSWTTDTNLVSAERNLGAVFFDAHDKPTGVRPHFTSAQIQDGGLIVHPENVELVTVKGGHFPHGVYHAFDYSLFYENLKANIAQRISAFSR
ncbi:DUF3089 domain-containing protein [Pseudodesulfovibrio senegalensis]|uniref:DUF3089 domain-containing protein n=2 Tax=Pseudodesulfovibrio senegalensis TaxID=1721087 RepID=A0A6N6N4Y1_9BACT|nr:DUF3089 domain-containing protein [Pseudodesulfovibrio senegalensis]